MSSNKMRWAFAVAALAIVLFYSLRRRPGARVPAAPTAPAPTGPFVAWRFASNAIFASLALGPDGTIYASSNQGLFAISPDGTQKWHAQYGGISYPTIGRNGMLYAASMYGFIFGVSPQGSVDWKPGYGLIGFKTPPAIGAGTILFANTTSDLYAFEPSSATAVWSQSTFRNGAIGPNASLPGSAAVGVNSEAAPVVYSDDTIALPRQHWITMFGRDGTPAWSLEVTPRQLGPAALGEDGTIYSSDGKTIYAVDHGGTLNWKYDAAAGTCCIGSFAIGADGTIYFTGERSLSALARDGRLKWSVTANHAFNSGPVLLSDGSVYVGTMEGLVAFNSDGSEKWLAAGPGVGTTPAIGADGTAYFVCGNIWICAVQGISSPLMKSPWPRIYHDSANTGNILTQF